MSLNPHCKSNRSIPGLLDHMDRSRIHGPSAAATLLFYAPSSCDGRAARCHVWYCVSDDIVPRTKTSSAENDDLDSTEETAVTKTIRDRVKNMMERRQKHTQVSCPSFFYQLLLNYSLSVGFLFVGWRWMRERR